jgi:chromate transport protein ChrA
VEVRILVPRPAIILILHSLPGAIAAYGLAIGISKVNDTLPAPAYALLSGLNSATVGIIALAAVQLSQKAITDKLTRILVFFGGTAGMLYNALWYYPILMVVGGIATMFWDSRFGQITVRKVTNWNKPRQSQPDAELAAPETEMQNITPDSSEESKQADNSAQRRTGTGQTTSHTASTEAIVDETQRAGSPIERIVPQALQLRVLSWKTGTITIAAFFAIFVTLMVLRGSLTAPTRVFSLFANLFLAGTIIFGGGPVVIPLLREYVVFEGWVSSRDFLLGLAIIQAFPGPNFNFAVYLGALAVVGTGTNPVLGALIGYVAIFLPGIMLHTGTMGIWKNVRQYRFVISALRGVNATAVGLVYAAVYRLWEIGFLSQQFSGGASLGMDPWWLVTTATSFVGGMWFGLKAPYAIVLGGVMGMVWYGVVTR